MQMTHGTPPTMPSAVVDDLCVLMSDIVRDIDAVAHATLAVVRRGEPWAAFSTDRIAEVLNEIEQNVGGPAVDALWSGCVARISSTLRPSRWPEYTQECKRRRVGSVVAFPISVVDARVGAITVASHDYYAFGPEQMRTGLSAATRAADILASAYSFRTDNHIA